jgi:hypothetical protein
MARKRLILMKDDAGIFKIKPDFFESIQSRNEALIMAMRVYDEINNTLLKEYSDQTDVMVNNQRMTDGFLLCLNYLEKKFPCLMIEMLSGKKFLNGKVLTYLA